MTAQGCRTGQYPEGAQSSYKTDRRRLSGTRVSQAALPVDGRQYIIGTDANPGKLGTAFIQIDEENVRRPVLFRSRKMSAPEQNYSATDKEGLAIVWASRRFALHTGLVP